ncbi:6,7-dimethyl-8-ribityllumazine synthase [Sulfobacillus harzensis]|uniref:6,7-dimethyl-8-ribityllumazine synthase n=1 Tax=Sulfobacillus harzensis TaxID=2729629 RepID=A0A7Y0Q0W5_9FIRM|nr:6,7-dimethyl-8-ribityllumazine synthase [Sulfobacillus harzensis]NMP21468.1 6,7-dimethyl-8-ribityllumazine synthase [Sulfobacillus harzensis]
MSSFEGTWGFPPNARVAVIVARFNQTITQNLLDGALETLRRLGAPPSAIDVIWVPGAFEIPGTAARLHDRYDALITLGAVIRGETPHFDYVAGAVANGVHHLAARGQKPVIFGVLTCNTPEEAEARAGGKAGNKGSDAAMAAVEMLTLYQNLSGA